MDELFFGKNGFTWWIGVVENNQDTLGVGRCQVRIYGWHNQDTNEIPTAALPWAYPILPVTNASIGGVGSSPVGLLPGSTVIGFFADGKYGQQPMIFGTLGGETSKIAMRDVPTNTIPTQPDFDKNLSIAQKTVEHDCPDDNVQTNSAVNTILPDYKDIKVDNSEWVMPFTGFVSSAYGPRGGRKHKGVDICPALFFPQTDPGARHLGGVLKGPVGLPVLAAAAGEVVYIWKSNEGQRGVPTQYDKNGTGSRSYGNAIALRHTLSSGTFTTIYAHLGTHQDPANSIAGDGVNVKLGDKVTAGQIIGYVGRTHVRDSLTHLHFEIRKGTALPAASNDINPAFIFPALLGVHTSYRAEVESGKKYTYKSNYSPDDAPCIAGRKP